ncbi:L-rhamnose mutarotase [Sediminitomix flava]|uniref:L-rhamnose mutarotase n=1 Tax=Sediminitomix flava TaxID=379075 RepID=A0A315Z582_SEDFL|nr:L-rhamnose mutarotase [Sediminitomix flava]PWJ37912.1 L-rhamnose mutarotase [Sediminitomix flava]
MGKYKRYCKTLTLTDNPSLIEEYKKVHAKGAAWKEITEGMKEVGILDMEIYLFGSQLFMIMDTIPDFDHDQAMSELAHKPRQAEWEAFVSRFQETDASVSAKRKWQLMDRIYELEQTENYITENGQLKDTNKVDIKSEIV